ncbi:hypothetical protein Hanom_Chr03g00245831 [Helianthus anomalus]
MASHTNQNQQPSGPPFDPPRFFAPSSSPPPNPNTLYPPPSSAASYPPPTVTGTVTAGGTYSYTPQSPIYHPQFHIPTPQFHPPLQPPNPNPNPNHGARLMALLSAPPAAESSAPVAQSTSHMVTLNSGSGPLRMPSSKLPKGRHLSGESVVYDIDVRLPGEVQPQLEVTPITKYGSDPELVLGRQIAVNKSYVCYGLKLGAIRVLNINTALRSLFKGLAQLGDMQIDYGFRRNLYGL